MATRGRTDCSIRRWLAVGAAGLALSAGGVALGQPGEAPRVGFGTPKEAPAPAAPAGTTVVLPVPRTLTQVQRVVPRRQETVKEGHENLVITINTQPPSPEQLFRLESEKDLRERIRQEVRRTLVDERFEFPDQRRTNTGEFAGRSWAPMTHVVEPSFLCHGRLFFEQQAAGRYGWELGPLHPALSAGLFYLDLLKWPYYVAAEPCRWYECNTGLCLPGDPVPLWWNPLLVK